jgi:titin
MRSAIALLVVPLSLIACDAERPFTPSFMVVSPPASLTATAFSYSQINLAWQDNSSSETGFEVHRSTTGPAGQFTLLATTAANVITYGDAGLLVATEYCYDVRSFTRIRKTTSYSAFSDPACATPPVAPAPPPSDPPAAPGPLTATVYPWKIGLWWQDNAWQDGPNKEDGFEVQRCQGIVCGEADFAAIAVITTATFHQNYYFDYDVEPGSTYTYRVRAFNTVGASTPSNTASATACFVGTDWEGGGYYICIDP